MSITKEYLDELTKAWSRGEPIVSDFEFDKLLEEYVSEHGDEARPFLRVKQSDDVNNVVGTLMKVFGCTKSIIPNRPIFTDWLRKKNINENTTIIVQQKLDGVSVAYDIKSNKYFTRGDYDNGESVDVSELFKHRNLDKLYTKGQTAVKFEAIMSTENFINSGLNKKYKRPRDVVSATITSRNKEYADMITLFPLREYIDGEQCISSELNNIAVVTNAGNTLVIQSFIDKLLNDGAKFKPFGDNNSYECDGVVVSVLDKFDEGSHACGEEVAIKILNMKKETKLIKVEFQFGKSGRITPVAIVEPIMFDGITVDHVTISTIDRLVSLQLKYNDTLEIMYNIIPYLIDSKHDGDVPIQFPKKCPICGEEFDLSTLSIVRCKNPNCIGLKLGAIIRYCQKMKMMGLSEGILSKLYNEGLIKSISDLYKLTVNDIKDMDRFGEKSAQNIINSIKQSSTNVQLHKFIGAFPMDDIGDKTWLTLLNYIGNNDIELLELEQILKILEYDKIKIKCIGDITRIKMINGLKNNINEMIKCLSYIKFENFDMYGKPKSSKGIVSMTGTRDTELTKYLTDKGYTIDSFTKRTIVLVIPNKEFTSSKVEKALQMNIPIYTIEEAYNKL